jgi:hypothetical protein
MIKSVKEKMIASTTDEETQRKINNMEVESICVPDVPRATPFTPLFSIIGNKKDISDVNLFLVIGDDRANMLDSITDTFLKWDNVNSVDGEILDRPNMGEFKKISSNPAELANLNISTVPVGALSASFVRNLVKNNMRDKFIELYTPFLDADKIPVLYEEILEGLRLPPNTKKDSPPKPLKYRYPIIKGVTDMAPKRRKPNTVGGKKTKRKNRKSTKAYRKKRHSRRR